MKCKRAFFKSGAAPHYHSLVTSLQKYDCSHMAAEFAWGTNVLILFSWGGRWSMEIRLIATIKRQEYVHGKTMQIHQKKDILYKVSD